MDKALKDVDSYIADFPDDVQVILEKVRSTIRKAAPDAAEKIGYGIPTYTMNGNLVHFGGFKKHIGFYPGPDAIVAFKKELAGYDGAKGSIQFPLDKPIPFGLITKMVKYRVDQNKEKAVKKSSSAQKK
ncbi:MAG TPA: DUF1801 domain-containing protein [Saprospiraceae bacterium]|nr:DUF1801 domain-containing protein [Saprospiraceae bacterium]